jgi:hypothetical protein
MQKSKSTVTSLYVQYFPEPERVTVTSNKTMVCTKLCPQQRGIAWFTIGIISGFPEGCGKFS